MKNNIFENAYFGKAYKTRDGRKAVYLKCSEEIHRLILEDSSIIWSKNDGKTYNGILESSCYDIVSEWQEELDKL